MTWLAVIVLCGPLGCERVGGLPVLGDHDSCINTLAIAAATVQATALVAGGPGALEIRGWCVRDDGLEPAPEAPSTPGPSGVEDGVPT